MRSALASTLAIAIAASSGGVISLRPAVAQAAPDESPEKLYAAGRKAFRLGNYEKAVEKFEKAYDLSDNAVLLYNIGLAYRRWHGVSKNIDHLRKAKAVLQNFILEAQRDPEGIGDPADAQAALKEIEEALVPLEQEEAERKKREEELTAAERAKAGAESPKKDDTPKPQGPDPGKKLRLAGVVMMGVGGAAVVSGVVLGVVFGLKGQQFKEELGSIRNDMADEGCGGDMPSPMCPDLEDREDKTIQNGRSANLFTALSFGLITGVGVLALVGGGVVFAQGNKRTKAWQQGRTLMRPRLSPVVSRDFAGLTLSGRF